MMFVSVHSKLEFENNQEREKVLALMALMRLQSTTIKNDLTAVGLVRTIG